MILAVLLNVLDGCPSQGWLRKAAGHNANTASIAVGLVVMLVFSNVVLHHVPSVQQDAQESGASDYVLDPDTYPGALATLDDRLNAPDVERFEPSGEALDEVRQEYATRDCRQDGRNHPGSCQGTVWECPAEPE